MRLYNAQSCTPVGSSSIYVPPKQSPPRSVLPKSSTFAPKWRSQQHKAGSMANQVPSKSSGNSSARQASKITSAFFDPFEIDDDIQFDTDPFAKNGSPPSHATSATEKLTPVVSSESHDLFAVSADDDGFVTFPEPFGSRFIDFQTPTEGELFNDASTWMTSSTLSTKFTNHEMNVAKTLKRGQTVKAFGSSPSFGHVHARSAGGFQAHFDKPPRPVEVFVRTPQPQYELRGNTVQELGFPVVPEVENDVFKSVRKNKEAFDPFAVERVPMDAPANGRDEVNKNGLPASSLPTGDNYTAVKANLRRVPSSSLRQPLAPIANRNEPAQTSFHQTPKTFTSRQGPRSTPFSTGQTLLPAHESKNARASSVNINATTENRVTTNADDVPSLHPSKRVLVSAMATSSLGPSSREHIASENKFRPASPTRALKGLFKEKNTVPSSEESPSPVKRLKDFVLSATSNHVGQARVVKQESGGPARNTRVRASNALSAFLAERSVAGKTNVSAPVADEKPSASPEKKNGSSDSPIAVRVKELTQGKVLHDLLSMRLGRNPKDEPPIGTDYDQSRGYQKVEEKQKESNKVIDTSSGLNGEPALKDDPAYSKYFKMLKMGLPMGAVKNAMTRDGVDASVMDLDHKKSLQSQAKSEANDAGVALKDDPEYAKYFKMLKLGLPMGAVKNALERDGKDPTVMDGDHNKPVHSKDQSSKDQALGGKAAFSDDPKYAKYAKMLKMGLALGAVKNAMERDGLDPAVLDGDHSPAAHGNSMPKDKFRRTRVHWETHEVIRANTVWAMVNRDQDVARLTVDEGEFNSLFQAESKPVKQPTAAVATEQGAVKVIDKKRANNGGITLARIKLSYREIAAAVESYDETALTQEQIRGILQYLPTSEEKEALRSYLGNDNDAAKFDGLCECEKFMVSIMTVKHSKRRLNAILYMQRFSSSLEELRRDARLVQKACDEIMGSSRFRKVLGMVLFLGNKLNTAGSTTKGPAHAITIESLSKLNQPKAFDKKTTFLQYVASVVRKNDASLCHFKDDLATVFVAEKLQWDQTLSELKRMETQLESVRRLALYHGLEKERSPTSRGSVGGDSATALSIPTITVEQEVGLLGRTSIGNFTLGACERMAAVVDEIENAKTSCNALLLYFGEECKTLQPHDVFQTISTFCRDFESAMTVVVENEKAQMREAKRRSRRRAPLPPTDVSEGSSQSGGSLQGRVPTNMSGVLSEVRRKPNLKARWRRRKHI